MVMCQAHRLLVHWLLIWCFGICVWLLCLSFWYPIWIGICLWLNSACRVRSLSCFWINRTLFGCVMWFFFNFWFGCANHSYTCQRVVHMVASTIHGYIHNCRFVQQGVEAKHSALDSTTSRHTHRPSYLFSQSKRPLYRDRLLLRNPLDRFVDFS